MITVTDDLMMNVIDADMLTGEGKRRRRKLSVVI